MTTTTREDVWLAVYRDALSAQRKEHPSLNEQEWALEAKTEADLAAKAFDQLDRPVPVDRH